MLPTFSFGVYVYVGMSDDDRNRAPMWGDWVNAIGLLFIFCGRTPQNARKNVMRIRQSRLARLWGQNRDEMNV